MNVAVQAKGCRVKQVNPHHSPFCYGQQAKRLITDFHHSMQQQSPISFSQCKLNWVFWAQVSFSNEWWFLWCKQFGIYSNAEAPPPSNLQVILNDCHFARKSCLNVVRFWVNLSLFFGSKLLVTSVMSLSKHCERRCCWSKGCKQQMC